ncbi:MAG: hypothetical protein HYZ75_01525 [Elusimicrobia bacterium]|nr:hypothetical protein [Elusimicrobiota bacterium]
MALFLTAAVASAAPSPRAPEDVRREDGAEMQRIKTRLAAVRAEAEPLLDLLFAASQSYKPGSDIDAAAARRETPRARCLELGAEITRLRGEYEDMRSAIFLRHGASAITEAVTTPYGGADISFFEASEEADMEASLFRLKLDDILGREDVAFKRFAAEHRRAEVFRRNMAAVGAALLLLVAAALAVYATRRRPGPPPPPPSAPDYEIIDLRPK